MLRCSEDLDTTYYIRLEPSKKRLVFDMWPRNASEVSQMVELERSMDFKPGIPIPIEIFMNGNIGVAYVNNKVAMNFRAYDIKEGNWGFFVTNGEAVFNNIELTTL